jgi:hypothetical protein
VWNGAELPVFGISRASSKKTCDNRKLPLISSKTLSAGRELGAVGLGRAVFQAVQATQRGGDFGFDPVAHFRRRGSQLFQGKREARHRLFLLFAFTRDLSGARARGRR